MDIKSLYWAQYTGLAVRARVYRTVHRFPVTSAVPEPIEVSAYRHGRAIDDAKYLSPIHLSSALEDYFGKPRRARDKSIPTQRS